MGSLSKPFEFALPFGIYHMRYIFLFFSIAIIFISGWILYSVHNVPSILRQKSVVAPKTLIDHVDILSMRDGIEQLERDQSVLLENGLIARVAPGGSIQDNTVDIVISGRGKTLLPGLIDAHVHIWDEVELAAYLSHGVTSVRNMSGMPFHLSLKEQIESGVLLGPDFKSTGPILNSAGWSQQSHHYLLETEEEAHLAVARLKHDGFKQLKLYPGLNASAYKGIKEAAQMHGLSLTGHTPEGVHQGNVPFEDDFEIKFEASLGQGFETIEHVESVVWHGLRDQLDLKAMSLLANRIAVSGEAITPTLIAHDNLVRVARSKGAYLDREPMGTLNPFVRFMSENTYDFWTNEDPDKREAPRAAFFLEATRLLNEKGVPLLVGTDAGIFVNIPGSSLVRELELFVKAGISPLDALRAATRGNAEILGFDKRGQIAPGFRANLILLSDNPVLRIDALETPDAVIIGGRLLDRAELDQLQDTARQTSFTRSLVRAASAFFAYR